MSYPGGKNGPGVFQTIINRIPRHRVFIEAFVGSGAVLRHKRPAQISYAIDKDPAVIEALTSTLGGLTLPGSRTLPETNGGSAEPPWSDPNGGAAENRRRSVNSPMMPAESAGSPLAITAATSPLLQTICADALAWLAAYKWRGDEFVYCDPPYLGVTRRGRDRQIYRYEMMTEEEHTALLDVLLAIPCPVMVSGYWSALYGRKLAAWRTDRYQATTRGGKQMAECLWMNYSEPVELHDYRYLGETYRERQDFKRMRQRWSKKLAEMPAVKRYAILAALKGT